jgi:hypothetical protein
MTDEIYSVAESTWIGNADTTGKLARIPPPAHWKIERVLNHWRLANCTRASARHHDEGKNGNHEDF